MNYFQNSMIRYISICCYLFSSCREYAVNSYPACLMKVFSFFLLALHYFLPRLQGSFVLDGN